MGVKPQESSWMAETHYQSYKVNNGWIYIFSIYGIVLLGNLTCKVGTKFTTCLIEVSGENVFPACISPSYTMSFADIFLLAGNEPIKWPMQAHDHTKVGFITTYMNDGKTLHHLLSHFSRNECLFYGNVLVVDAWVGIHFIAVVVLWGMLFGSWQNVGREPMQSWFVCCHCRRHCRCHCRLWALLLTTCLVK